MRPFSILLVVCMIAAFAPRTAAGPYGESVGHLHPDDYTLLRDLPLGRSARSFPVGFKYRYVDSSGVASTTNGAVGTKIEVAGSPDTSDKGLEAAADVVAKMTKYMPQSVFKQLATTGSVGVFTASEKLIVYPEYAYLASGNCGASCSGNCDYTCSFDGRKLEDLAGVGGTRATILEANVLCTDEDPYQKRQNILAHEFAHTIHSQGLSAETKKEIETAYNNAKTGKTWEPTSYAMSTVNEYFAEAATAFHYVSDNNNAAGGMVNCWEDTRCQSLEDTRGHLKTTDPDLFKILKYVFTDNRPDLDSGLTVCPP